MGSISQIVKDILKRDGLLQEAMNRNIVSYSKLASYIKPEIEKELGREIKPSAIVMAIRRLSEELEKHPIPRFHYSIETMRTGLSSIIVACSPTLLEKLEKMYDMIDFRRGGVLNIVQGNHEIAIITNSKYKEKLIEIIGRENVLEIIDDLASISLAYPENFLHVPGVVYDVTRFLAWENINIVNIILTKTEFSLIVSEKDLMRCYSVLNRPTK